MTRRHVGALVVLLTTLWAVMSGAAPAQYSLCFAGPGRTARVEGFPMPESLTTFGVELRIKVSGVQRTGAMLVSRWDSSEKASDAGDFALEFLPSHKVKWSLRNADGRVESVISSGLRRDQHWHHVAAVYDGKTLRVVVDGKVAGNEAVEGFGALATSSLPLVVGHDTPKRSRRPPTLAGFISDVALFRRARTIAVIAQAGSSALMTDEPGLIAYYPLVSSGPVPHVDELTSRAPRAALSPNLARSGWSRTASWSNESESVARDLHCHDLASGEEPARIPAGSRSILLAGAKGKRAGVLWQHAETKKIYLTWVDPASGAQETFDVEAEEDDVLVAGTSDPRGNVYLFVVQALPHNRFAGAPRVSLYKTDATGKRLLANEVSASQREFNVWSYNPRDRGSMRYSKGSLGLVFPRRMNMAPDGLRHQGAIAVTFSAKSIQPTRHLGQTSGHSFGNVLTVDSKGDFIAVDLGDNYPRGVHLHRFSRRSGRQSRVVFTFKTRHGTRPHRGAPRYPEISGGGRTFYKWSNDNATYTELGGVIEGRRSYVVMFSTDRSPGGKVLDNSRAFRECDDPRNLAAVRVVKAFHRVRGGNQVLDAMMAGLPKGNRVETGGFYNFVGGWVPQRVTGVLWLTNYGPGEGVHAPHSIPLDTRRTWVLFEKSGGTDAGLFSMEIDDRARVLAAPRPFGINLTLEREESPLRIDDRIVFLAADQKDRLTRLYQVIIGK